MNSNHFDQSILPLEIYDSILRYQNGPDLAKSRLVCKDWKHLSDKIMYEPQRSLPYLTLWYCLVKFGQKVQNDPLGTSLTPHTNALKIFICDDNIFIEMNNYQLSFKRLVKNSSRWFNVKYVLIQESLYIIVFYCFQNNEADVFQIKHSSFDKIDQCNKFDQFINHFLFKHNKDRWRNELIHFHYFPNDSYNHYRQMGCEMTIENGVIFFQGKMNTGKSNFMNAIQDLYNFEPEHKYSYESIAPTENKGNHISCHQGKVFVLNSNDETGMIEMKTNDPINRKSTKKNFKIDVNFLSKSVYSSDKIGSPNLICIQPIIHTHAREPTSVLRITIDSLDSTEASNDLKIVNSFKKIETVPKWWQFWFIDKVFIDCYENYYFIE